MAPWPVVKAVTAPAQFDQLLKLRQEVNGAIEQLRGAGEVGSSLETTVVLKFKSEETKQQVIGNTPILVLERLFIVSSVQVVVDTTALINYTIKVEKALGEKCGRCWKRVDTVGTFEDHPTICHRCRDVVMQLA
jgi:isoleucyl-tRNA synthetase